MSLPSLLGNLDGSGYGGYKKLHGSHQLGDYRLIVDKVQSDPFAPPSLIQVITDNPVPEEWEGVAAADFLTRRLHRALGQGLFIDAPGQQVLQRATVVFQGDELALRLEAQLPARGRRILGRAARRLLCDDLPAAIDEALDFDDADLRDAVELYRDQEALRAQLPERGLVGFLADGAILPRRSGDSELPAAGAVPFQSPDSLREDFTLPSGRTVTGMGVPQGVTLIVGGGYHGKSTLLKALERGVYNHVAGDGREFAITVSDAASLRAEDGRAVTGVDISQFINNLPQGTDTHDFSTPNASGSTSQSAGLIEALEADASTLLIDEDTSATNFMIRDARMRRLVPTDKEPITPLMDRVRALADAGVSTVLVAGGSGAFIDVADTVIQLAEYHPYDVTERAKALAEDIDKQPAFPMPTPRTLPADAINLGKGKGKRGPKPPQAKGLGIIRVGKQTLDIQALTQLVDPSQTRTIAAFMNFLRTRSDSAPLAALADDFLARIADGGLDAVSGHRGHPGRLALPRKQELLGAVNRYRGM